jgi:hypothetical protein
MMASPSESEYSLFLGCAPYVGAPPTFCISWGSAELPPIAISGLSKDLLRLRFNDCSSAL